MSLTIRRASPDDATPGGLDPAAAERDAVAAARATDAGDGGADVVIINTCSVRENAATRLFGNLGQLAAVKRERPGMQIAVAGCLAQQMRGGIVERAPWVDAVLGTHNLDVLPALLASLADRPNAVLVAPPGAAAPPAPAASTTKALAAPSSPLSTSCAPPVPVAT